MKRWLKRITLPITVVAAAALTGLAGPAVAAPPAPNYADPFVIQDFFGNDCPGFNVTAQLTGKSKEIFLSGNRKIQISPATTITLSANGKTVSYVITGASHIQVLPNGTEEEVKSTGKNLLIVPNVPGQHVEGLFLTTGNVNYARTTSGGEIRFFSGPGQVVDVCALLAP
ncbi:MAG: hypothetical protein JWQ75_365 [Pseudarthrobacter sp.]|nr:hypothetical protein [Pseudarthrobacter sp.]